MKLDLCLLSCDLNIDYIEFIPLQIKIWKDIVDIKTKIILIAKNIPENLNKFKDDIILFNPIENIPTAFQAQCIRILYPSLLNGNIIISDMDLIPLRKDYFINNIINEENDKFIVYRDVISNHFQYPICFCAASSNTWKSIFKIETIYDIEQILIKWYLEIPYNDYKISSPHSFGWALDQIKLYKYVNEWNHIYNKLILLKDEDTNFKRLDRTEDLKIINKEDIKNGLYTDFHLPRPYSQYKNIIDNLLQITDFAYITFVNNNQQYIDLLKVTINSIIYFSKFKLIIYCIDMPDDIFIKNEQIIVRHLKNINLPCIYYYKPYIIIDAINKGLTSGYYIESDDVITPFADDFLYEKAQELNILPISPIHPDDVIPPDKDLNILNVTKTQHYIHAHVLFKNTNLSFLQEWYDNCFKSLNFINADETVLNCMYWKYNCKNHYLYVIDPWYEFFYNQPENRNKICTYHGCKNNIIQKKLLDDMILYFTNK